MTPTESQKREALRITSEHTDSMSKWEQAAKVLAHLLRLAESELAEARKECAYLVSRAESELSALRAENDALRADDVTASPYRHLACKVRWEAAEAKVASMTPVVEAAKKYKREMPYNSCGCYIPTLMELIKTLDALRETEGGATPPPAASKPKPSKKSGGAKWT